MISFFLNETIFVCSFVSGSCATLLKEYLVVDAFYLFQSTELSLTELAEGSLMPCIGNRIAGEPLSSNDLEQLISPAEIGSTVHSDAERVLTSIPELESAESVNKMDRGSHLGSGLEEIVSENTV